MIITSCANMTGRMRGPCYPIDTGPVFKEGEEINQRNPLKELV